MLNILKSLGFLVELRGFVVGPSIFAWDGGILIIVDNNKIFEADMTECTVDNILCLACLQTAAIMLHFIYTYGSFTCSYRMTTND